MQDFVLLEVASEINTITKAGTTWIIGTGASSSSTVSSRTTTPTTLLVTSNGVCQRGWIAFSRYLRTGMSPPHCAGEIARW